jgi:ABC-type transport system involved in cytochrome c biogenesis permease subunit
VACGIRAGHFPVNNLHETLSFTAWAIAVVFLAFAFRFKLKILGIYAAPLISLTMIVAYQMPKAAAQNPQLFKSWWLAAHIVTMFLGNAAFALACGLGVLYLLQENAIKRKPAVSFSAGCRRWTCWTPPATPASSWVFDDDHRADYRCGLRQGCLGPVLELGPQGSLVAITWLVLRGPAPRTPDRGMAGRRAAIMAIIGFGVLLFTFFGVNFLLQGIMAPLRPCKPIGIANR